MSVWRRAAWGKKPGRGPTHGMLRRLPPSKSGPPSHTGNTLTGTFRMRQFEKICRILRIRRPRDRCTVGCAPITDSERPPMKIGGPSCGGGIQIAPAPRPIPADRLPVQTACRGSRRSRAYSAITGTYRLWYNMRGAGKMSKKKRAAEVSDSDTGKGRSPGGRMARRGI
jgi:hypothetical protein